MIAVIGAGESGTGAAVLAKKKGYEVFVSDNGIIKDKYKNVLLHNAINFEEGKHNINLIASAEEVIISPGISDSNTLIAEIKKNDIAIISEIEFAGRYSNAFHICVSGSNGKTTTSMLIWHILKNAGMNVGLAGNVGTSFALSVAEDQYDYYVLELSSFQLDKMFNFRANIAILLNITPDHLDRYKYNFQNYINSKFRIIQNQTSKDSFIYCADDEIILSEIAKGKDLPHLIPFSLMREFKEGAYLNNNELIININNDKLSMTLEELALQGKHNIYNSMAAGISTKLVNVRKENIKQSLSDFQCVEHRLEPVANVHGVEFINDSKATNINSVWYAFECMSKPIIWIAGGVDKGNDYTKLLDLVKTKVKAIVCLGLDNNKILDTFSGMVESITETYSAEEAVAVAFEIAKPGDVVLLSPACASFDLHDNFQERGRKFKQAVRNL